MQIQKYLNGELDAKAMHRLEREAQDDPFLMDALEGYAAAGNQQANLADLTERLNSRTGTAKVRRIIPWTTISIATGVVGFMLVVGLLYKGNNTTPPRQTAQVQPSKNNTPISEGTATNDTTEAKRIIPQGNTLTAIKPKHDKINSSPAIIAQPGRAIAAAPAIVNKQHPESEVIAGAGVKQDTMPLDEMIALKMAGKTAADTIDMPQTVAINKKPMSQNLDVKVKGLNITERLGKRQDNNAYALGELAPKVPPLRQLSGVVVSRADGLPIPGVTVNMVGKTTATQTDANGKFNLPAGTDPKQTLAFSSLGYSSKEMAVKPKDSLKVELNENTSSLNEVVVGYSSKPTAVKSKDSFKLKAHPQTGWDSFNAYLQKNAVLPSGAKTGTVILKFTVGPNGSITNIKTIKSLTPVADEQATSIIRNGPKWVGNTNQKAEVVMLSVQFTTR